MTVAPSPAADAVDNAEALIEEARRRHRRRRRAFAAVALLMVAGVLIGLDVSGSGSPGRPGAVPGGDTALPLAATPLGASVKELDLSKSDDYDAMATVAGRLFLYGPVDPATDELCNSAVVDPTTLSLSHVRRANCDDPSLEGRDVIPVESVERQVIFGGGSDGVAAVAVRLSRVVSKAPGYALGPVVLTFPQASSSWPSWVYGDGDLWLYDDKNPGGVDLLRISGSTGAVIQRLRIPDVDRPILAFDDDGLWIAPAANSTGAVRAVYHVAVGASFATSAFRLASDDNYVVWMLASGHTVFVAVDNSSLALTLWDLTGSQARPVTHARIARSVDGALNGVETQGGSTTIVGTIAGGLWTVDTPQSGTRQDVLYLDPVTGAPTTVTSLHPGYETPDEVSEAFWKAVGLGDSMYLLDPPVDEGTYPYQPQGFSALFRISPRR